MPSITLELQTARLLAEVGREGTRSGKWSIAGRIALPHRERLELATGENIRDVELRLSLRETEAELVKWATERTEDVPRRFEDEHDPVIGTISYHPEWSSSDGLGGPASILFDLFLPAEVMASLIRFAECGRFLKTLTVEARGLDYGYGGDGSEKVWPENDTRRFLPVSRVSYELTLSEEAEPDYLDDEARAKRDPKTPVGADLAPILREILKFQRWALIALAAVASATVVNTWR